LETVSVIIPTHNRKKYLKTAIESVLEQSYPIHEIIVVDDSSEYDITSFLDDYNEKIILIRNDKQMGCAATYNKGIKASSGDFVTILNDDDVFHPLKIQKQLTIFQKNPELGIVYCPIGTVYKEKILYKSITNEKNKWNGLYHLNNIGITPLIKKSCFDTCGLFDTNLCYNEDRDLWYRIGKQYTFGFDTFPLYLEYNHTIQRLSSSLENICQGRKEFYRKHKNDYPVEKDYFSDLYFELAHEYQRFGNHKTYVSYILKSISIKPNLFFKCFKIPYEKIKGKNIVHLDAKLKSLINKQNEGITNG
jgi:glycosyltransferase involved in cell wall biosynthesis